MINSNTLTKPSPNFLITFMIPLVTPSVAVLASCISSLKPWINGNASPKASDILLAKSVSNLEIFLKDKLSRPLRFSYNSLTSGAVISYIVLNTSRILPAIVLVFSKVFWTTGKSVNACTRETTCLINQPTPLPTALRLCTRILSDFSQSRNATKASPMLAVRSRISMSNEPNTPSSILKAAVNAPPITVRMMSSTANRPLKVLLSLSTLS